MKRMILLAAAVATFCAPSQARTGTETKPASIEGIVIVEKGKPTLLQSQGKSIPLSAGDGSIADTIQDPRVSGKQLKVVGEFRKDGSFEVSDLFVVHPDGLYRIIYFCNICHITAFRPGNCVCCQRPTELQEVPLSDPRVHQEKVP